MKHLFILFALILIQGCGGGGGDGDSNIADTTPPSTPANLVVVAESSSTINLSWDTSTDNVAVVGYKVYKDGGFVINVTSITYSDTGLNPDTQYCYIVSSYDAAGNESAQSVQSCTKTPEPPDITPPAITSTNPLDGATDVDYDVVISATFSEAMMDSTINNITFTVIDSKSNPIIGAVTYNNTTNTASFTLSEPLGYEETYTVKIASTVKDLADNTMTNDVTWSFTTKAPQVSFAMGGSYFLGASGSQMKQMIAVDLNSDNHLDLAYVDFSFASVSVMLGDGTGAFGTRSEYAAGGSLRAITYGYFNGNTNLDLAVANEYKNYPDPPGTVSILLGDGAGAFAPPTSYDVGERTQGISTGDFNGDSIPDIAATNLWDNNVSVLIGSGTGTFFTAVNYPAGFSPATLVNDDYNNDGILDLAVANVSDGHVSILSGTNLGTFGLPSSFTTGGYPRAIATDDLNKDGEPDLAVGIGTNNIAVLLGDGLGGFGTAIPVTVEEYTNKVFVADLNIDGINDLIVTTNKNGGIGSNAVYVILGYGESRFGTASPVYIVNSIFIEPPVIAIGDFNEDGKLDMAIADPTSSVPNNHRIYFLLNTTP